MSTTEIRSKVVIQDCQREPVVRVAVQLLGVLGHDVSLVDTAEEAISTAASERTDLMVLSVSDTAEQGHQLDRIALMPRADRPRQVAILSDEDAELGTLRRPDLPGVKIHVFVKSVHAHGLLSVIKRMAPSN